MNAPLLSLTRLLLVAPLLLACSLASPSPTAPPPTTEPTPASPTELPASPTVAASPTAPPVTATVPAVELTPAQLAAVQALSADQGLALDQISVVSTEAVDWPDGCLGVVRLGVLCTQGLVPGYRIILSAGGQEYEYHTNQDGTSVVALAAGSTSLRLVLRASDGTVQTVDTGYELLDPALLNQGLLPFGGPASDGVYLLSLDNLPQVQRLDENGAQALDFGYQPNYALAVWPGSDGEPPRVAFGTSPTGDAPQPHLIVASVDGSSVEAVVTEDLVDGDMPFQLLALRWSADGQSLYFSREPYGIGGYIPFAGASSLYRYDLASQSVTELVPFNPAANYLCLGDLSLSALRAVGNCTDRGAMTIYNLDGSGDGGPVLPPAEGTDYTLIGSARFSPDAGRVAFGLARGNPEDEQGWIAVSDGLSGEARLIATAANGSYFTVVGWLNDSTLLLQQQTLTCAAVCPASLWTVGADGSGLAQLIEGFFLAFDHGR